MSKWKERAFTIALSVVVAGVAIFCIQQFAAVERPKRAYAAEIEKLRMVRDHQALQLEVMKLNAQIAALQAQADANIPVFELAPAAPAPGPQ